MREGGFGYGVGVAPFDWEILVLNKLTNMVNMFALVCGREDRWIWNVGAFGCYNTKDAYNRLLLNEVNIVKEEFKIM